MKETCYNKLIVTASTDEAKKQLSDFKEKAIANKEPFLFYETYPTPVDLKNKGGRIQDCGLAIIKALNGFPSDLKGIHSERWDAYEIKILQNDENVIKIDFLTMDSPCADELIKLSKDYPELVFSNIYSCTLLESVVEVQNGEIFDHYEVPSFQTDIKSNNLEDYQKFSMLHPFDKNGNKYPFTVKVINPNRVVVRFADPIQLEQNSGNMEEEAYSKLFIHNIIKFREAHNLGISYKVSSYDNKKILQYSKSFSCSTISQAVELSLKFMNELHKPIDEFVEKVKDLGKKELGLDLKIPEIKKPKKPLFT